MAIKDLSMYLQYTTIQVNDRQCFGARPHLHFIQSLATPSYVRAYVVHLWVVPPPPPPPVARMATVWSSGRDLREHPLINNRAQIALYVYRMLLLCHYTNASHR